MVHMLAAWAAERAFAPMGSKLQVVCTAVVPVELVVVAARKSPSVECTLVVAMPWALAE